MGVIFLLFLVVGIIIYSLKEAHEDGCWKRDHPNNLTYTDGKGRTKLTSNDRQVMYYFNENRDWCLMDIETGSVLKNFTEEERNTRIEEYKIKAKENNESTYCIDDPLYERSDKTCTGNRYKDFKTGSVYVIRKINFKYYYMSIYNGTIVRKTDWQTKEDEMNYRGQYPYMQLDIEEFNKKQLESFNKGDTIVLFKNSFSVKNSNIYK